MKKYFKKEYLFIISVIFLTSITTLAFSYDARDVGYTPSDVNWNVDNVKDATDSLYYSIKGKSPIGEIIAYMGTNAPEYFLECDGTVYNISEYPYLAEQIKREFGSYSKFGGNGTTTFAVPDLRGEFLRGRGTNSHANQGSGANVGIHQDATLLPYYYKFYDNSLYGVQFDGPTSTTYITDPDVVKVGSGYYSNFYQDSGGPYSNISLTFTTRPTNTSILYAIRYE